MVYGEQKNAWMNSDLFAKWCIEDFILEVQAQQQKTSTEGKTLLLLDNAPCTLLLKLEKEACLNHCIIEKEDSWLITMTLRSGICPVMLLF